MAVINPTTYVGRMRLMTGDTNLDEPFLSDAIYTWFYAQNGSSEVDGAIAALNTIINQISLNPLEWAVGDLRERQAVVETLNNTLTRLTASKYAQKTPVIIKTDRTGWCDFDKVFK